MFKTPSEERWIEDIVHGGTTVAGKRDEYPETAIQQEQKDMNNAEKMQLTMTMPETTYVEMLNANGHSLSDDSSSDDAEDTEDKNDDEEHLDPGKLREYDLPGRLMGTMLKTVQYQTECFLHKDTMHDALPLPG